MSRPTQITTPQADRLDRESPRFFGFGGAPKLGTLLKRIIDSQVEDKASLGVVEEQVARGFSLAVSQVFSDQPAHLDYDVIGGDTYQFLDPGTGVSTSVAGYIGVEIGDDLAATGANLAAAINNTARKYHSTLLDKDGGPAAGWGSENVTAVFDTDTLIAYESTAPGSGVPSGGTSIALNKSGATIGAWSYANLNLIGRAKEATKSVTGAITIAGAWVTAAAGGSLSISIAVGFDVDSVIFQPVTSAGLAKARGNDVVKPDSDQTISLILNADDSSGPDLVDGDVVHFVAYGS